MASEPKRGRWGRLKRSNSDDGEYAAITTTTTHTPAAAVATAIKQPRQFFKKGTASSEPLTGTTTTTTATTTDARHRRFVRRRSAEDDYPPTEGENTATKGDVIIPAVGNHHHRPEHHRSPVRFRRKSGSHAQTTTNTNIDSTSPETMDEKRGIFRRRKRTGITAPARGSGVVSDGEVAGMHSDEESMVAVVQHGNLKKHPIRSPHNHQGLSSADTKIPLPSSLKKANSADDAMAPLRKGVSFNSDRQSSHNKESISTSWHKNSKRNEDALEKIPAEREADNTSDRLDHSIDYNDENDVNADDFDEFGVGDESDNPTDLKSPFFREPKTSSSQSDLIALYQQQQQQQQPTSHRRNSRERARYSVYHGAVKRRFRVRPYHCFPDPLYMTEEEIYANSLTPSQEFVPLKSYLKPTAHWKPSLHVSDMVQVMWGSPQDDGRIGALRVEVLGCVSLNRTKPDVSVYLVCGDAAFCTDLLSGYGSPMWPSNARRACIFPIHHAYAKLYVGVFDARIWKNKDNDVFCGRVVVDIATLRPDTEYDTTMPLRASAFVYDRRKRGVIRLRFSLHWFNQRAAVTSYLKAVRNLDESCPLVEGQPSIPCADPKTFRNVAITVYGQDLPGKYSRNAFRATMREFNLYQQNLRLLFRTLILDAMLYEEPWISAYLFGAAMFCVLTNSVRLVPAFFVGYILIIYVDNYKHYIDNKEFHFGYKPLTALEIFNALIMNSEISSNENSLQPLFVSKWTKRRRGYESQQLKRMGTGEEANDDNESGGGELVPMDHREFPFSERTTYQKFCVEEALAPGSGKASADRLHGRLSVYYSTEMINSVSDAQREEDEDNDEDDSDRDDETVMTESQMMGDNLFDMESDNEEDSLDENLDFGLKRRAARFGEGKEVKRRIRTGPPQDNDVIGRKVPPQLVLKKAEHTLHKLSKSVSVELVHETPKVQSEIALSTDVSNAGSKMIAPSPELQAKMQKKARKMPYDDFDRLLGLQSRGGNPVHRIMASFLGPLMRMIRVAVFLVRISFNAATWRDPYLSFWILFFLVVMCLVLMVFPWRSFFFLSSVICLGPQNIFVRRYLEKKLDEDNGESSEKEIDQNGLNHTSDLNKAGSVIKMNSDCAVDDGSMTTEIVTTTDVKRGFFAKFRQGKDPTPFSRRMSASKNSSPITEEYRNERPAFESALHGQSSSSRKLQPRSVVIPYSRLKKERFYDWPPDPTVSRATPIQTLAKKLDELDDSLTASVPDIAMPEHDDEDQPSTLRRRIPSSTGEKEHPEIPTSIMF
jgi:hypothetical protein